MAKLVVLLLAVTLIGAENASRRPLYPQEDPAIPSQCLLEPFKEGIKYTYLYQTTMEIPNPLMTEQKVAIRFRCRVQIQMQKSKVFFNKAYSVRAKIIEPVFKVIETNPSASPVPLETVLPDVLLIQQKLKPGFVFDHENGVIKQARMSQSDSVWVRNIKRGIMHLFTVDLLGMDRVTQKNTLFAKQEKTIFGKCDCVYNMNDTMTTTTESNKPIRITKSIDVDQCRIPFNITLSTAARKFGTQPTENPLKAITFMDFHVLRSKSNWKLLSVVTRGAINLHLLGGNKKPMTTLVQQTLSLSKEEKVADKTVEIPKSWKVQKLPMEVQKTSDIPSPLPMKKLAVFIYNELTHLQQRMKAESNIHTKEITKKMVELVQILRPLRKPQLKEIWSKCATKEQPEITSLFLRVFSMVRTELSVNILRQNLPEWIEKPLLRELLLVLNTPAISTLRMVKEVELLCRNSIIRSDINLKLTCFTTLMTVRRQFCEWNKCKKNIPADFTRLLQADELLKLQPENMLKVVLIVELAADRQLFQPLTKLIVDTRLPLIIRERCIIALKPLVPKMRGQITSQIFELLFHEKFQHGEVKTALYSVLLEQPTPFIIQSCVYRLIKFEKCQVARRFAYETLLALATTKDLNLPATTRRACEHGVTMMRIWKLIPTNSRILPHHLVRVFRPITSSNIKLTMKNQIHFTKKSMFPRYIQNTVDAEMFGRTFKLIDLDIAVEGLQELFTKLMKVTPKDAPIRDMEIASSLRFLSQPITSTYKKIKDNENKTLLEKALPESIFKWRRLAEEINKELNVNVERVLMPVEVIVRLPTAVGIPLVHELTTVIMYQFNSSVHTETPSIFDLPRLAFGKTDLKLTSRISLNAIFSMHGRVLIETPMTSIGINHTRTIKTSFSTSVNLVFNPQTMKLTDNIKMPELPEILTTESETEMIIQRQSPKWLVKRIPTLIEQVLPQMHVLGEPVLPLEALHSTSALKVSGKFVCFDEANNKVVLGDKKCEWVLVPVPTNNRIVSLYLPKQGFVYVDMATKTLKVSPTERAYFCADRLETGLRLKTLVPVELKKIPSVVEREEMLKEVFDFVNFLVREEIVTKEVRRAFQMRDVNPLKAVKVMFVKLEATKATVVETPQASSPIVREIIKTSTEQIACAARAHGTCLNKQSPIMPFCLYGIVPRQLVIDFDTILLPMVMEAALPDHLKELKIVHTLESKKQLISVTMINLVGTNQQFRVRMVFTEERILKEITIQRVAKEHLFCANLAIHQDAFKLTASFHPKCKIQHIEIETDPSNSKQWPRLQLRFNWILRPQQMDLPLQRIVCIILEKFFLPRQPTGIERISMVLSASPKLRESQTVNGSLIFSLINPQTLRIRNIASLSPSIVPTITIDLPLPRRLENLPIGRKSLPLVQQLRSIAFRQVCKHSWQSFVTFDQVEYKYDLPTVKCDHVLFQTRPSFKPQLRLTTRKQKNEMKIVRFVIDEEMVEITPLQPTQIPKVTIAGKPVTFTERFQQKLQSGRVVIGLWIAEEESLVVIVKDVGVELRLIAGRTVLTNLNPFFFHGQVEGLCGNMDSEYFNDLTTPEKQVVTNTQVFGLTWLMPDRICSKTNCPLVRSKKMQPTSKCLPMISLPACREHCTSTKEITVQDVPVRCPKNIPIDSTFKIPIDCKCSC